MVYSQGDCVPQGPLEVPGDTPGVPAEEEVLSLPSRWSQGGTHHSVVHGAARTAKSDIVPKVSSDEGGKLAEESWTKQTSTRSGKMNGFITNTIYV